MTEQERQTNNMLLQLIQQHFRSLPLSDEYTNWSQWLAFANAAYKAGADAEREECAKLVDEEAEKMAKIGINHRESGFEDSMDRCYARSHQCTTIAEQIRQRGKA